MAKASTRIRVLTCILLALMITPFIASCSDTSAGGTGSTPQDSKPVSAAETTKAPDPAEKDPGEKYCDGYYILAETSIPFIAKINNNNVDCEARIISTITKLGRYALFVEIIRDGSVINTERFNGVCAVMATAEKSDRLIIMQIVDNLKFNKITKIRLESYCVSDLNVGNGNKKLDAPKFQKSYELAIDVSYLFSVESISELVNPSVESAKKQNDRSIDSFASKVSTALSEYELSHSKFYCVMNAITQPKKPTVAFPSDKLPLPDIEALKENSYLKLLEKAYSNYQNFTEDPDLATEKLLDADIPNGMKHGIKKTVCEEINISYDCVTYTLPSRRFGVDHNTGGVAGIYMDVIDVYDNTLMASTVIEGYSSLYTDQFTASSSNSAAIFILENLKGTLGGDITISCAKYQFTDLKSSDNPIGEKFGFRIIDHGSAFTATVDLSSPDQADLDLLVQFGDRIEEMIKECASMSHCANSSTAYACGLPIRTNGHQHSDSDYLPEQLIKRYYD